MNLDENGARPEQQLSANPAPINSDHLQSVLPTQKGNQVDVWLQRASHLSQFGLFIFTALAIYFTVIPLYQKALLDEAIARKEIELKEANAAREKAYSHLRFFILSQFVFRAGSLCTGLLWQPPPKLEPLGKPSLPIKPSFAELLESDVPACLTRVVEEHTPLKDLRPEDRKLFDESLLALSGDLLNIRQSAKAEYDEVPKRAAVDRNALSPPGELGEEELTAYQKRVRDLSIWKEQSRIGAAYGKAIRERLMTLLPKK